MSSPGAFSVIVPTYNRLASLDACVRGLAAMDFPHSKLQIVVVNDGGGEIPEKLRREWAKILPVCVVTQPNAGVAAARNFGVQHARHEWIAFIDDDCVPDRDWLTQMALALKADPNAVMGGTTVNGVRENVYAEASQAIIMFLVEYYHQSAGETSQVAFFPANNLALARRTFDQVGGFNNQMRVAEERDFFTRLAAAGAKQNYVRTARVVHYRPMNPVSFLAQHQFYGGGAYHYQRNRTVVKRKGMRPESLRFYAGMLGYPKKHALPRAGRVAGLVALSQIAYVFGFLREVVRAQFGARR